jgi:hypothetical protein
LLCCSDSDLFALRRGLCRFPWSRSPIHLGAGVSSFLLSPRLWSDRSRARHLGTSDRCKHRPGGLQLLAPSPGARFLEARDSPLQGLGGQWFQLRTEVHRLSRWAGWHRRLFPPRSAALATSPLSRSSMGSSGYAVNPGSSLLLCCSDSDLFALRRGLCRFPWSRSPIHFRRSGHSPRELPRSLRALGFLPFRSDSSL